MNDAPLSPGEISRYLETRVPKLKKVGRELRGPCPIHQGKRDSFAIDPTTGLWYCHSACDRGDDLIGLEMTLSSLEFKLALAEVYRIVGRSSSNGNGTSKRIVDVYPYPDESGTVLFRVVRTEPKSFFQQRPDGHGGWINNMAAVRRVLFDLPAVSAAKIVWVVEGEKDARTLRELGLTATCNPGGAGKWRDEYSEVLRGKQIFIISDADTAGRQHASSVLQSLTRAGVQAKLLELPGAKDAAEWIERGGTLEALVELAEQAQESSTGRRPEPEAADDDEGEPPGTGARSGARSQDRHQQAVDGWPEPSPLGAELPPVQAFRISMLPEVLRDPVEDLAHRMQVPVDYPGVCSVVTLAGAVNRRARIQPKERDSTWIVVPNAWGGLVAPPGFLKSPVLKAVTAPVVAIERLWREEFAAEAEEYETQREAADLRLSAWKEQAKAAFKSGKTEPIRPDTSLRAPTQRRLIIGDSTFEKTHELMAENPSGLLILRDELSGWMSQLDRPGREGERAFSLEAWNGDSGFSVDRIGRGSIYVPACCLSILGAFTPGRLKAYLADALKDGPGNDGLIQRFQLLVWPDAPRQWTYVDQLPLPNRITDMLRRLTSLDADFPATYTFNRAAQGLFIEWLTSLEQRIRSNTMHQTLVSHLSKLRKTIPSLALLFALADVIETSVIDAAHTEQAISWAPYLESHARRIYSCIASPRMQAAADLVAKIREGVVGADGTFARRDVYRHHWTGLDTPDAVGDALEILHDAGWVRPRESAGGMGRPPDLWEVNPRARANKSAPP
jgi:putative DNA primase/helicase